MSPELKQTIDVILSIVTMLCFAGLIIAVWYLKWKSNKQERLIELYGECWADRDNIRKELTEMQESWADQFKLTTKYFGKIKKLKLKVKKYKFIMSIADEISADMFKDNERLHLEVELLKAKLNHKKIPQPCCQKP